MEEWRARAGRLLRLLRGELSADLLVEVRWATLPPDTALDLAPRMGGGRGGIRCAQSLELAFVEVIAQAPHTVV